MKRNLFKFQKGFTLIELMVAIAIVAILATVGFTLLQSAQAGGRDSKRLADIDAASQALETNWNATTSQYPRLVGTMFTTNALPMDPLGPSASYGEATTGYFWNGVNAAFGTGVTGYPSYIICAQLEKGGGNSTVSTAITAGTPATYYCKKNQQS